MVAKVHTERLPELKANVEESRKYFDDNVMRFEEFMRFVFKTSLTAQEKDTLASLGKPTIEFNILEEIISRSRGEFAKQEPSVTVRIADGVPASLIDEKLLQTVDLLEAHYRAIFAGNHNDMLAYNVFTETNGGGFSAIEVYTDYINEKAFDQNIYIRKVFDSTLTFWDPLARLSDKSDGRFCGALYPMPRKQFEEEYGKKFTENIKNTKNVEGFKWSFKDEKEDIVLVAEYYEKKYKKETIYKLTGNYTLTKDEYEAVLLKYQNENRIEQPPAIIDKRITNFQYICRYRFCQSDILDYIETDFKYFPLVFVDGNSVTLKENGASAQMTRPSVYQAKGAQKLKNFSGQTLAAEIENTVAHKFKAAIESIPTEYLKAYTDVQKPNTLIYKHFLDKSMPEVTLPPPQEIMRSPIPGEIPATFQMMDDLIPRTLGTHNPSQDMNNAQLSGIGIARTAIQSNTAAMPYVISWIKALNHTAQIIKDLIPKYFRAPRTIAVMLPNGKRSYQDVNGPGQPSLAYDPNLIDVVVEPGVNFLMQKEMALQTVLGLCQASKAFADFFNQKGLPVLLDNIEIRGIDRLKVEAEQWMQQQQQMSQQQSQAAQQQMQMQAQQQALEMQQLKKQVDSPTEGQLGAMMIEQKAQNDTANLAIKAKAEDTKFIQLLAEVKSEAIDKALKAAQIDAENQRSAVDSAIKIGHHISQTLNKEVTHA